MYREVQVNVQQPVTGVSSTKLLNLARRITALSRPRAIFLLGAWEFRLYGEIVASSRSEIDEIKKKTAFCGYLRRLIISLEERERLNK